MQRGNYPCKASDAVKLAAIHYYVWHGPFDATKEQFSLEYMHELRLGEQLMPTPLVTAQQDFDWEARIHKEQQKISEIFSKLSAGRGITASEAKVMYIKKVRKLPMYGTTLFHVHNSKIFPSGHFLVAAHSSGVQFLHPVTKEELHSPFFFSDLQRWEYTPKVFCFWSTKCDFLDYEHQGRHIVKYSLSTKQGWEISTTLHSYYKVLMNTDVSVNTSDQPLPAPSRKKSHIAYDAESGSDDDEGGRKLAAGGTMTPSPSVTTFTPQKPPKVTTGAAGPPPPPPGGASMGHLDEEGGDFVGPEISLASDPRISGADGGAGTPGGAVRRLSGGGTPGSGASRLSGGGDPDGPEDPNVSKMKAEYDRVKKELEEMRALKSQFDELRKNHEKLQTENEEVRKIVGDMYVSHDEDRVIRDAYTSLYREIVAGIASANPRTGELMPKLYDLMVRMNDEDIRKEYIIQMEIILNDDPAISAA